MRDKGKVCHAIIHITLYKDLKKETLVLASFDGCEQTILYCISNKIVITV